MRGTFYRFSLKLPPLIPSHTKYMTVSIAQSFSHPSDNRLPHSNQGTVNGPSIDSTDLPLVTLQYRDQGHDVIKLQTKLVALDLYPGQPTGRFDVFTRRALQMIQHQHGLVETGCFDVPTWYALSFWEC